MKFNTSRRPTENSSGHAQERERRQQLPYLIERLGEIAPDIPGSDLREQIYRWLALATRLPTDGQQYVENRLESLNSDYAMYRERGKDNDECFPEVCLNECKHAEQQACPMLNDMDVLRRRRRIHARTSGPTEFRTEMKSLAGEVDCHVVSKAIRVVEETHQPIIRYGQLLLSQAEEDVNYADRSEALDQELASMDLTELAEEAGVNLPAFEDLEGADDVDEIPIEADVRDVDDGGHEDRDGDEKSDPAGDREVGTA